MKIKKSKFFGIWFYIAFLLSIAIIIMCFDSVINIPQVYWSYSKNECVKVIDKGIECDCSELPEKYERIWVK